ncbi:hypothetical protein AWC29_25440 [Mycobacterium triplex]|uniref:EsaT-6 like protein EsxN n=1 Tax=Mycobacterium triplex TaxID=47839 RepID=A0A024JY71_9MYCO|nr:hypothetical protein [Mycobacterium triplex]ORX00368.1 hypothetical protein AWC29_25440 [Mycobacterium triplex]CDO88755.1 EsaT-6 like protein EsxN [Mycobacterium triplex]
MTIIFQFGTGDGRGMLVPGTGDAVAARDFWAAAGPVAHQAFNAQPGREFQEIYRHANVCEQKFRITDINLANIDRLFACRRT